ncbi:putative periplasmic serine endoprotease DegP-like precursor [bacterium BMS3Bbin07]|nr:putative periplasmic serine endoprotease DegP-like precursor [bacterium BMS3Bbin07]
MKKRLSLAVTAIILMMFSLTSASSVPETFSGIVKLRAKSVVNISTTQIIKEKTKPFPFLPGTPYRDEEKKLRRQSLGSGFIIDEEGYILTNSHVIDKAEDIRVRLWDETEYKATVVGRDQKTDIALIKVEADRPLPVAPLGDSDALEVGDWIIAIGNPFGLGHTVTAGIVSAKGRVLGSGPYDDFIQTDAAINPGNSGGPLFNLNAEVVGISSAIFSTSGGNIGIGFAIPINLAKDILFSLKEKGFVERGWLGVTVQKVTPEIAESFGLRDRHGALVTDVTKDSPADRAGIQRGDIIVGYNGKKIEDMHELPRLVASTPVGASVNLKIFREGKELELNVIIEKLGKGIETPELVIEKILGLRTKTMHPAIAEQLGIRDGGAVLILGVIDNSPAERQNIQKGDVILEVNRKRVTSTEEMASVIKELDKGDTVLLLMKRNRGYVYVSIRLE